MEVSAEAKRIMVVALGKLYSSRSQRGGLRLHRSLLLTLVMKSARDIYHEAQAAPGRDEDGPAPREPQGPASNEPRTSRGEEVTGPAADDKENRGPTVPAQLSRKRRGKAAAEPDFLPCKKAKLEQANGNCPQQLIVSAVMVDYVTCGSELGGPTGPVPLQRVVAAC